MTGKKKSVQPAAGSKYPFAGIPIRAMMDRRLQASHWRVLAAIPWHDRFGRNGVGCTAGGATIAREANIHVTNLPKITRDLQDWGYIDKVVRASNRRLRTYHVIYDDGLDAVEKNTNEQDAIASNDRTQLDTIGEDTNNGGGIVGVGKLQVADSQDENLAEYIPLRGHKNRNGETEDVPVQTESHSSDHSVADTSNAVSKIESLSPTDSQNRSHSQYRSFDHDLMKLEERHQTQLAHQRILSELGPANYELAIELDPDTWAEAELAETENPGVDAPIILGALKGIRGNELNTRW